jgi:hypothetical protein
MAAKNLITLAYTSAVIRKRIVKVKSTSPIIGLGEEKIVSSDKVGWSNVSQAADVAICRLAG